MILQSIKNRVRFTRKKKCDVCKEEKKVAFECEDCYNNGFEKTQNTIWEMAQEDILEGVLKILAEHPRSDNYSVNGRLVSANSVIRERVGALLEKPRGEESLKRYSKGWKEATKEANDVGNDFIMKLKTDIDLLQHDNATLGICEKEDVEKLIDKLSPFNK